MATIEQEFDEFYRVHHKAATAKAHSYVRNWDTAKDVTNEAFTIVWKQLHEGNTLPLDGRGCNYVYSTIKGLAKNLKKKGMRKDGLRIWMNPIVTEEEFVAGRWGIMEDELVDNGRLADDVENWHDTEAFKDLVKNLSTQEQQILQLRYEQQYTIREISSILHLSKSQVDRIEKRSLETLRKEQNKNGTN